MSVDVHVLAPLHHHVNYALTALHTGSLGVLVHARIPHQKYEHNVVCGTLYGIAVANWQRIVLQHLSVLKSAAKWVC